MASRAPPSTRWASFDGWDYDGMKERLEVALATIDKPALVRHAEAATGKKLAMSEPFSAGQYWICFELIATAEDDGTTAGGDGSLIIARVRLPRHPDTPAAVSEEDEQYSIACEVATMKFVRQRLPSVRIPRVYAYEAPGSKAAEEVGAAYMLLEGFYGNTLLDVEFDMCNLPIATQEHIITQWTKVQAELATLSFPLIGSISSISSTGEPVIGKLATAPSDGLPSAGPFSTAASYFTAVADATAHKLGALVLRDIVQNTTLFQEEEQEEEEGQLFPLSHMDLGTQNILVDDEFNFVAVIDWEFAQTAPWQVNHYPYPFPKTWPDEKIKRVLRDPGHIAHKNIKKHEAAQRLYVHGFRDAGAEGGRFAEVLESPASRIYACFAELGRSDEEGWDDGLVRQMAKLAFKFNEKGTERYLIRLEMEDRLRRWTGARG